MSEADVKLCRRWFEEVWNQGRTDVMHEILAPDGLVHGVGAAHDTVRGPKGFLPGYEQLKGAFPDIQFTIEEAISERDIVALRWTARMSHQGDHLGVPATNNPLTVTGMSFARVKDGIVVEAWNNWDMMGMMHGIGQAPQAAVLSV